MTAAPAAAQPAGLLDERPEQRSHQRYPIRLEVEYKLLNKGRIERVGSGRTLNISSGGVFFEAKDTLPANGTIELLLSWPLLLEGVCPLKLVMRGRIVRHDGKGVAISFKNHE